MKHKARFSNVATVARAYLARLGPLFRRSAIPRIYNLPRIGCKGRLKGCKGQAKILGTLQLLQLWLSCLRQTVKYKSATYGTNCFRVSELVNLCYITAMIVLTMLSLYEFRIWNVSRIVRVVAIMLLTSLVFHCKFAHRYRLCWLFVSLWVWVANVCRWFQSPVIMGVESGSVSLVRA